METGELHFTVDAFLEQEGPVQARSSVHSYSVLELTIRLAELILECILSYNQVEENRGKV